MKAEKIGWPLRREKEIIEPIVRPKRHPEREKRVPEKPPRRKEREKVPA